MQEIWKDIDGFDGMYQVSNKGNIRSQYKHGELMSSRKDTDGYLMLYLRKNGKRIVKKVHRLVAMAFIDNPNRLPQVNHKDEDKTNNCVENLEWCTLQYNLKYGTRSKRSVANRNYDEIGKKHRKKVVQIGLDGKEIKTWVGISEAAKHVGIDRRMITHCLCGNIKAAGGYVWKFPDAIGD